MKEKTKHINPYKGKFKQLEVAKKLSISPVHLNGILCGRVIPSIKLAIDIEKTTGGIVRAKDLRKELSEIV